MSEQGAFFQPDQPEFHATLRQHFETDPKLGTHFVLPGHAGGISANPRAMQTAVNPRENVMQTLVGVVDDSEALYAISEVEIPQVTEGRHFAVSQINDDTERAELFGVFDEKHPLPLGDGLLVGTMLDGIGIQNHSGEPVRLTTRVSEAREKRQAETVVPSDEAKIVLGGIAHSLETGEQDPLHDAYVWAAQSSAVKKAIIGADKARKATQAGELRVEGLHKIDDELDNIKAELVAEGDFQLSDAVTRQLFESAPFGVDAIMATLNASSDDEILANEKVQMALQHAFDLQILPSETSTAIAEIDFNDLASVCGAALYIKHELTNLSQETVEAYLLTGEKHEIRTRQHRQISLVNSVGRINRGLSTLLDAAIDDPKIAPRIDYDRIDRDVKYMTRAVAAHNQPKH